MSAGFRTALRERASRHPGLWWVALGCVFGALALVRWALVAAVGGAVLFYGVVGLVLLVTGAVVEVRAITRRRSADPPG